MILVADSSALIALSVCNSLTLLDQLFNEVIVPEAVFKEVTNRDKPEAQSLEHYLHGKVHKVDMRNFIYLDAYADIGETEAMLLYKQKSADKLLIDDKRGRQIAKINGINMIGSLGVLLSAKQAGLISEIKPRIKKISKSRIYLSEHLIKTVLELADEK
jgi:predicted nucleic acid-binding protein